MGRDNNNAGIHFKHWNHYGKYENLEIYDRLEEEKRSNAIIERKKKMVMEKPVNIIKSEVKAPCGIDEIVNDCHKEYAFNICSNIFCIGLEKKLDIIAIIKECRELCYRDCDLNPDIRTLKRQYNSVSQGLTFLSLLAKKMECQVSDFFEKDDNYRKRITIKILENLRVVFDEPDIMQDGNTIMFDASYVDLLRYSCNLPDSYIDKNYFSIIKPYYSTGLSIARTKLPDGNIIYTVYFGYDDYDSSVNVDGMFTYINTSGYLWYGTKGRIPKFINNLIEKYQAEIEELIENER